MAKNSTGGRRITMYRSAKTGKAVTKQYAETHKSTTEKEMHRAKPKGRK